MECSATGNPLPQIKWKKNGVPIEQVPRLLNQNPYFKQAHELKIYGLMKSDEGDYTCIASNSKPGVIVRTHKVKVLQYTIQWTQENPELLHVEPLGSLVRNLSEQD